MCRCKIVVRILLIVSVFNFVLAAPAAVRDVREAWADAVDGGEDVITALGKRTQQGDLYPPWPAQQDSGSESESGSLLRGSQHQGDLYPPSPAQQDSGSESGSGSLLRGSQYQGSASGPNYASGTHPGIQQGGNSYHDSPARYDSSGSGSDSDSRLTWWSEDSQHQGSSSGSNYASASGTHPGIQQGGNSYHHSPAHYHSLGSDSDSGTSTEVPEASSSKAKSVTWGPTKMIPLSPPPELSLPLPPQ